MKKIYIACLTLAAFGFSLSSCEEKKADPSENNLTSQSTKTDLAETARLEFSKSLAQALGSEQVREFLKKEALLQFDGDYDVLYALVKDKKLSDGKTFEQTLEAYSQKNDYLRWSENDPLLTIFIPNLNNFNAQRWDIQTQIPDVVLDNSHLQDQAGHDLLTITRDLNQYNLDSKKAPTNPVVVIKENERIVAKSKADQSAKTIPTLVELKSTKVIGLTETHSFYFIGDSNPKQTAVQNARFTSAAGMASITANGWFNGVENQRDWTYYYISPVLGHNSGSLANYTEKLRGFKINSSSVLQTLTDNWTEGSLEFNIYLTYIQRDGSIGTDLKTFFCQTSQLMNSSGTMLEFNPDVELRRWDLQLFGTNWKFSIQEHDAGTTVATTVASSSTFGNNFSGSSPAVKTGIGLGSAGSFVQSNSMTLNYSQAADQLGSATLSYDSPVITNGGINLDPNFSGYSFKTSAINTGSVELSIEPVQNGEDSRPHYEP